MKPALIFALSNASTDHLLLEKSLLNIGLFGFLESSASSRTDSKRLEYTTGSSEGRSYLFYSAESSLVAPQDKYKKTGRLGFIHRTEAPGFYRLDQHIVDNG